MSLIYFPFWVVPVGAGAAMRPAVVGGMTGTVVRSDAPASPAARLDRAFSREPEVAGFRSLVCPNCGWDLPVRPDDVIFSCGSCERAWQIHGTEFSAGPVQIAQGERPRWAQSRLPTRDLPCVVQGAKTGALSLDSCVSPASPRTS